MTDSSFMERLSAHETSGGQLVGDAQSEVDHCAAFGWLRGLGERASMLELRFKGGNITALGYGWLDRLEFDPSEGIALRFGGTSVRIQGRNLNEEVQANVRLFEALARHRVTWIHEAGHNEALVADPSTVCVETITL